MVLMMPLVVPMLVQVAGRMLRVQGQVQRRQPTTNAHSVKL